LHGIVHTQIQQTLFPVGNFYYPVVGRQKHIRSARLSARKMCGVIRIEAKPICSNASACSGISSVNAMPRAPSAPAPGFADGFPHPGFDSTRTTPPIVRYLTAGSLLFKFSLATITLLRRLPLFNYPD